MIAGRLGGRPSLMTEELVIRLEDALCKNGFAFGKAARAIGVHPNSLTNWCKRYPSLLKRLMATYLERETEISAREGMEMREFYETIGQAKVADLR